jgi:hypothetical protein
MDYEEGENARRVFSGIDWEFIAPTTHKTKQKENTKMTKLYEITLAGKPSLYGHKLATNSQGQWVMEVKGTGEVIAVDKSSVEEVMPYTISVSFGRNDKQYAYLAEAGKYSVGDLFLMDAPLGRAIVNVTGVDTKSASATVQFNPLAKLAKAE